MARKRKSYYGILRGFYKGVTDDWSSCRKWTMSYPGNCYQGFSTLEEAKEFLETYLLEGEGPYYAQIRGRMQQIQYVYELTDYMASRFADIR